MVFRNLVLALAVGCLCGAATAAPTTSNLERERNWADQIVDTVVVGDPVWLRNRGVRFLALYAPPKAGGTTAVILLHGRGVHPAWGFIDNLRSDLADAGFHTLSLQLPILASDAPFGRYGATFPEAFERIEQGIRYLRENKGVRRIVLIGHSSGSMTAVAFVAKRPDAGVDGVVAIGLSTLVHGPDVMQPVLMLRTVRVPVLDIFGADDLYEVVSMADARRAAAAGNARYQAIRVPDADHFFADRYEPLKTHILNWLRALQSR